MKSSDKLLAICAIVVSLSALGVSIYQTRILSMEKDAAVWPYLRISNSWGGSHFELTISNKGIGPAIIKNMHYNYQDSSFSHINNLVDYLLVQ